ncbi:hypothetical protein GEU84_011100 [Fertoebacter nigrum]|uniref:Uncharacterized protein n=1 Tax=Fertoeibacter niger TaxID=2656921 RepID=A0A8X8GV69_9RHOB|nr:hypothetical protein [Fertoeibacter niger]NUB44934.1 hypothetical protein [Fertoeibacter niger]
MSILSLLAEILFVGHSLVGPDLAPLVQGGFRAQGVELRAESQIINGAPLKYNWENSAEAEGVDARMVLPRGNTQALVLTEGIPLLAQIDWNDTVGQARNFASLAWQAKPTAQVFIYETWHSLNSGTGVAVAHDEGATVPWRDRLTADLPLWQGIADELNKTRPATAPAVRLIPAGQAMGLLADEIAAGRVPGMDDIRDAFSDDIHPNGKGRYLVAMVHMATMTGKTPEGLPAQLTRQWASRDAVIADDLAPVLQRIAWAAVQAHDAATPTATAPVATEAAAPLADAPVVQPAAAPPPRVFAPVTNPALALGLAGVYDWSVQQPFLDLMKSGRPWIGHLPGQWGGFDHPALAEAGYLDENGWPKAMPPNVTGISTVFLTDLPPQSPAAGRYVLTYEGKGTLALDGRATNAKAEPGRITFDYLPGEGSVLLNITAIDETDPLRNITILREDRQAEHAAGQIFNPEWLARIRGVASVRFMDWMMTNNATLALAADRPLPGHYTWAVNGVPVEVMVALANELDADPWFTIPHLAEDALVRAMAEVVRDGLEPGLRAHVEYSNEMWNWQFGQTRWAEEQGLKRWGEKGTWVQYYALRATEVAGIWAAVFGDQAPERLVRVISSQTGWLGLEEAVLDAPQVVAEGLPPPKQAFDAYAVTGYFSGGLGNEDKAALVKGWLAESRAAAEASADALGLQGAARAEHIAAHRFDLAVARAAAELATGAESGKPDDSLENLLGTVLPYQADVAAEAGLDLVMYEGGTHVVGYGLLVDDAELTAFFTHLNYTPEMGALYARLLQGWQGLTDAPFNAFVDVYSPGKWGSWGALRHLADDNPRWQALAAGCAAC